MSWQVISKLPPHATGDPLIWWEDFALRFSQQCRQNGHDVYMYDQTGASIYEIATKFDNRMYR